MTQSVKPVERGKVESMLTQVIERFGRRGTLRPHYPALHALWLLLDALIAIAVLAIVAHLEYGYFPQHYRVMIVVSTLVVLVVYPWSGLFDHVRSRTLIHDVELLLFATFAALGSLVFAGYLTDTLRLFSPRVLATWVVGTYATQLLLHLSVRTVLHIARRHALNIRRAALIGYGEPLRRVATALRADSWMGIEVAGYVDTRPDPTLNKPGRRTSDLFAYPAHAPALPEGLARLGGFDDLEALVQRHDIDEVYLTIPIEHSDRLRMVVERLVRTNVGIKWVPDMSVFHLISHSVSHLQGQPVFSLTDSPLSSGQSTLKWLEDIVLGTCLSILALPALLAIAIAVKMSSPGPIFYVQLRHGLHNQPVRIWKFRTMYVAPEGEVARQATEDDPRVTPVGQFLRRWSLDELPQLLQVPLGYLSLVGPRPHPIWLNDRYSSILLGYMQRHRVKPGLTGWAQVNGLRGETDTPDKMEARLHCDLYYINNWSLLLDLKIILRTLAVVIRGTNAL